MKTYILTALAVMTSGSAVAQEAPVVAVAPAQPLLMTLVLLAAAVGCVVFCFQVFTLVRGGQLSRSWLLFSGGFALLAVSQVIVLLNGFGFVGYSAWIVPLLMAAMTGLFIYGLWETKRVLG